MSGAMSELFYYRRCASTNQIAAGLAKAGARQGVAVITEVQDAGRGRLGKTWVAPPGKGLYCSLIVRPDLEVKDYPKITLIAGLAAATVLEQTTGIRMMLKWPNDVYAAGKKCCGILTESASLAEATERYAIVGIGVNINSGTRDFPEDLQDKVTSLSMLSGGRQYDILAVFSNLKSAFFKRIHQMEKEGFAQILIDWRKRDMLFGKQLQWLSTSGRIVTGVSEGPDEEGRLQVKDGEGRLHTVLSGDISLAGKQV